MLLVLKLVTEVVVDRPKRVRLPLLAMAQLGERSRRVVVGMMEEGLKQTCHRERKSFFFKMDSALQSATAIFCPRPTRPLGSLQPSAWPGAGFW